jgi:hypothetical protein
VAELPGHPPGRFAGLEHQRGEGVPRLVERADAQICSLHGRSPHALAKVRDIEWPTVPVREHPRALELVRLPLGQEGLLDDGQHVDVALRLYGLGRSLAETGDRASNSDRPPSPVDVVPLEADLLAGPKSGEEGDAEVPPIIVLVQTLGNERLDLDERKRIDLRLVLAQEVDAPRGIVLEPSLGHGPIKRLLQHSENDIHPTIGELLRSSGMLAPVTGPLYRHRRHAAARGGGDGRRASPGGGGHGERLGASARRAVAAHDSTGLGRQLDQHELRDVSGDASVSRRRRTS